MSGSTPRLGLPYPGGDDGPDGADIPYWLQALANALDPAAMFDKGLGGSRPDTPVDGVLYWGTDTHLLYFYANGGWTAINVVLDNAVTTAKLADLAVTTAKLADASITNAKISSVGGITANKIATGTLTATQLSDTLKPSAGASGATETLRALGTAAGTAAAGNDARLNPPVTAAKLYLASSQNVAAGGAIVLLDTSAHDAGTNLDLTNHRYTAPVAGAYQVHGSVLCTPAAAGEIDAQIYVNGAVASVGNFHYARDTDSHGVGVSDILALAAGDHVQLFCGNGSASAVALVPNPTYTRLAIARVV